MTHRERAEALINTLSQTPIEFWPEVVEQAFLECACEELRRVNAEMADMQLDRGNRAGRSDSGGGVVW